MSLTQLEAMALTFAVEAPVAALLAASLGRKPVMAAAAAIAGSCVTHPVLWAVFADAEAWFGVFRTPILEAGVAAVETLAYAALATPRWTQAALLSIAANTASWGAGELVYALT